MSEFVIVLEEILRSVDIIEESLDDSYERFFEEFDNQAVTVVDGFIDGNTKTIPIIRVPEHRLAKIWLDYGRSGVVRDVKGLERIKDTMGASLARLMVSTELMGHTESPPYDLMDRTGYPPQEFDLDGDEWTDELYDELMENDKWLDYFNDERGNYYLSDYGLKPLQKHFIKADNANTPEEMLIQLDHMLNVVHQRSDLAGWFVVGGASTLNKIATQ